MNDIDFSQYFYYDETSPSCLRWKVDRFWGYHGDQLLFKAHSVAGCAGGKPGYQYYRVVLLGKEYGVHRVIWSMVYQTNPEVVDHLDGNTLNNHIYNLMGKTTKANTQNKKMPTTNKSGKIGVRMGCHRDWPDSVYAIAFWSDEVGKNYNKWFSVKKFGLMPAYKMACEYREARIRELIEKGEGYTERHGQPS